MTERTRPNRNTRAADREDAEASHRPDRAPTPDEEAAAPTEVDDATREAYREMAERGADVEGEGRIA